MVKFIPAMIELSRTVRFCLNGPASRASDEDSPELPPQQPPLRHNGFSAWPPMRGLGRYYQLHVSCAGEADPATGYFISIKLIDRAVADTVLPYLDHLIATTTTPAAIPMGLLMQKLISLLQAPLGHTVVAFRLDLTPYYTLTIRSREMNHVILHQEYEFAAAHRLHAPQLSPDENREVFGKCNNPSGHGHNYRLRIAVRVPITPEGDVLPVEDLDGAIDRSVIQKLDHKHLNIDVPQFAALNPSVENIAMVAYDMAQEAIAPLPIELEEVKVWETDKTVCTYRGPSPSNTGSD